MNQGSRLAEDLAQAAAIKAEMTALLRELEQTATGQPIEKPGAWRHRPAEWAAGHFKSKSSKKPS